MPCDFIRAWNRRLKMATSTGKTIGLILLVAFVLLLVFRMTPLVLAPLGIFPGIWHIVRMPKVPHVRGVELDPYGFINFTVFSVLTLTLLIIWILVIVWVYRDAERRGMNGVLWALLVFIGNLIGLLIYLIVRSDILPAPKQVLATVPCPKCEKSVASNFAFCPHCGAQIQTVCPECGKPIEKDWRACPHCGKKLAE